MPEDIYVSPYTYTQPAAHLQPFSHGPQALLPWPCVCASKITWIVQQRANGPRRAHRIYTSNLRIRVYKSRSQTSPTVDTENYYCCRLHAGRVQVGTPSSAHLSGLPTD